MCRSTHKLTQNPRSIRSKPQLLSPAEEGVFRTGLKVTEQQAARGACGLQLSGLLLGRRRTLGTTGSRSKEAEPQQLRPGSDLRVVTIPASFTFALRSGHLDSVLLSASATISCKAFSCPPAVLTEQHSLKQETEWPAEVAIGTTWYCPLAFSSPIQCFSSCHKTTYQTCFQEVFLVIPGQCTVQKSLKHAECSLWA